MVRLSHLKEQVEKYVLLLIQKLVFWNQAVAAVRAERNFRYPDYEEDDGDIDLFAGTVFLLHRFSKPRKETLREYIQILSETKLK